jgi:hypothetical protein
MDGNGTRYSQTHPITEYAAGVAGMEAVKFKPGCRLTALSATWTVLPQGVVLDSQSRTSLHGSDQQQRSAYGLCRLRDTGCPEPNSVRETWSSPLHLGNGMGLRYGYYVLYKVCT